MKELIKELRDIAKTRIEYIKKEFEKFIKDLYGE